MAVNWNSKYPTGDIVTTTYTNACTGPVGTDGSGIRYKAPLRDVIDMGSRGCRKLQRRNTQALPCI